MGDGVDCPIPTCAKLATCTDRGATCTRSVNTEHTSHAGLFVGYGATADLARIHAWSTCWNYLDDYGFLVCGGSNYLDHIACACTINEPSQTGAGGDLAWECFPNVCCIQ